MMLLACALAATSFAAKPITRPWPQAFPAKDLCSNCGLCKSSTGVTSVMDACAFIGDGMSRAESLEESIHGRVREYDADDLSEAHFGVHSNIVLARGRGVPGAQWTGVTTAVACEWLRCGAVDAVVVAGSSTEGAAGFGAPKPVLARSVDEVLQGRRVKPSLCPSLEILDEVRDDPSIKRLLFCGVGCSVQALRAMADGQPEAALGLEEGGLFVLGTHCVDNSPTPQAAQNFVSAIPGVGAARANDVLAYEFMADFRVHARLKSQAGGAEEEEDVVKQAYMTLPPSVGVPSIAPSCFSCFDYTNGLADLVVGYMGAPFDADGDEMTSAPLMVTVRNARGRAMLDEAVRAGSVEVLQDGGHGGKTLPSTGDREAITMKTVAADSMVKSLLDPEFVAGDQGAPPLIANLLAGLIRKGLPTGLEFGRFSIDYHYLRNQLFCADRMGDAGASRHIPTYAKAIMARYDDQMLELKRPSETSAAGGPVGDGLAKAVTWLQERFGGRE